MNTAEKSFDFRTWMCGQKGRYKLVQEDDTHYHLMTDKVDAQVNFYPVEDGPDIVEFRIDQNNETKFFLHFQPIDPEHAKSLFQELVHKIYGLENEKQLKILLCCSAGLTTSYFAEKLNQTAAQLNEDIGFSAVDVNQVCTIGEEYDAVLVAPQVGYMTKRLQECLPDVPVVQISAQIFGSYDAPACIKMVLDVIEEAGKSREEKALEHVAHHIENNLKILIISALPDMKEAVVRYRIFDHGKVTLDKEVIKEKFNLDDLLDIIHTNMMLEKMNGTPIDAAGVAIPGMLHNGVLEIFSANATRSERSVFNLIGNRGPDFNLQEYLTDTFQIPVLIHNNVNAAAVGWYGSQDQYSTIVMQSQPVGFIAGGQGIIVNGVLLSGAHDSAGELRYLINQMADIKNIHRPITSSADMLKVVTYGILAAIVEIDPQVVCVRSPMTPDMNEIREELSRYLPQDHIPELVYIGNMDEYVLLGEMILVLMESDKNKNKGSAV